LAEQEGIASVPQEVACQRCRRFLCEISVESRAVLRLRCPCGADNFLVAASDRLTYVQAAPK
jgi:Zn finger protein HypA/HybF involved in hydrogenase expression